jgi:hypothetical protein
MMGKMLGEDKHLLTRKISLLFSFERLFYYTLKEGRRIDERAIQPEDSIGMHWEVQNSCILSEKRHVLRSFKREGISHRKTDPV